LKNKGKQQRSKQTIDTILTAAAQVLAEEGYERASTNRIAEKAGYSVGTLYQYFNDKEDVYNELVSGELGKIIRAVNETSTNQTLSEMLVDMMSRAHQALGSELVLVQALGQLIAGPFRGLRATARAEIVASIVRLLQAHKDEIALDNLHLAAETLVSATEGLAVNSTTSSFSPAEMRAHELRLQLAYLTMQ